MPNFVVHKQIIKHREVVDDDWSVLRLVEGETPEAVEVPEGKFIVPLTTPNDTTKAKTASMEPLATPNSLSASAGITVRCRPMVSPTKNTCSNCWRNGVRFCLLPNW